MTEKRKHPRFAGDWTGVFDTGNYIEEVAVTDLSLGGCLITHSGNLLQGTVGLFRLTPFDWIHAEIIVHDVMMPETISAIRFLGDVTDGGVEQLIAESKKDW